MIKWIIYLVIGIVFYVLTPNVFSNPELITETSEVAFKDRGTDKYGNVDYYIYLENGRDMTVGAVTWSRAEIGQPLSHKINSEHTDSWQTIIVGFFIFYGVVGLVMLVTSID